MTSNKEWDVELSIGMELPRPGNSERRSKKVVMPDIYASEYLAKEAEPETADQSLPDIGKSVGFNPYDTGVLRKK